MFHCFDPYQRYYLMIPILHLVRVGGCCCSQNCMCICYFPVWKISFEDKAQLTSISMVLNHQQIHFCPGCIFCHSTTTWMMCYVAEVKKYFTELNLAVIDTQLMANYTDWVCNQTCSTISLCDVMNVFKLQN